MFHRVLQVLIVPAFLLAVAIAGSQGAKAQSAETNPPTRACEMLPAGSRPTTIDSNAAARDLVCRILAVYGLRLNESAWSIVTTRDYIRVPNALATFENGQRVIKFNSLFLARIKRNSAWDWPLLAIAAHEVGHQLGNHVLRKHLKIEQAEREADYHAGYVLGRMGADYSKAVGVIRWLPRGQSKNYPPRGERLCEIGRGWRDGKNLEPIVRISKTKAGEEVGMCRGEDVNSSKYTLRTNVDIPNEDIYVGGELGIQGIDLASCSAQCDARPECKAFSFERWHSWCFLKSGLGGTVYEPTSIVGVKKKYQMPPRRTNVKERFVPSNNRRFYDTPMKPSQKMTDRWECERFCEKTEKCMAYTFVRNQNACLLFSDTIGHYVDEGADSGYRQEYLPKAPGG